MCKRRGITRRILEEILQKVHQPLINVTIVQGPNSNSNETKEKSEKSESVVTLIVDKDVRLISKL
jgi:hypothetical protein